MSYDIELVDSENEIATVPSHMEGANIVVGGSISAYINVTLNYSWYYYQYLDSDGIRYLDQRPAKEVIPKLIDAIIEIQKEGVADKYNEAMKSEGHDTIDQWDPNDGEYWKPSPENAVKALKVILEWSMLHPECTWRVF